MATKPMAPATKLIAANAANGVRYSDAARLAPSTETRLAAAKRANAAIKRPHGSQQQSASALQPVQMTSPEFQAFSIVFSPLQFLRNHACPVHHASQSIARSQRQYGCCIREHRRGRN